MHIANIIVNAIVAVGTLLVAAAAIWGDWLRSRLSPPKLIIQTHNIRGDPTAFRPVGTRVMYFHLKVVNQRPWLSVPNCRVLLKGLSRRGPDGRFHPIPMTVPSQFIWAPAEFTPPIITLVKEQIFDFGCIAETQDHFFPTLYTLPNNFQGFVHRGEAVRYHLQIEATNFASPRYQIYEVAWDGNWSFEPDQMEQHLRISEIQAL